MDIAREDHPQHALTFRIRGSGKRYQGALQPLLTHIQHINEFGELGGHRLRRRCGCGAPAVAHHIANRIVGLVSDAGHHGHGTGRDGAGEGLVVEGHEILEGTTTANEQDAIGCGRNRGRTAQPLDELGGSTLPLDLRPHTDDLDQRVAAAQRALDIVDDGTG